MLSRQKVDSVKILDRRDITRAAQSLKSIVEEIAPLRIGASADIASGCAMTNADGDVLAQQVFGWVDASHQWWKKKRFSLVSPLSAACRYESNAFWANARGFHTVHPNCFLDAIDLGNFEEAAMTHAAIVVPIHLPFGRIGAVVYNTTTDEDDLSAIYERWAEVLSVYARTFITSYIAVTETENGVPTNCSLSAREVECLEWAAVGKTDNEIASILSRSRATVRFHIQNASAKLNSVNRSQTVFKAAQLGFVCPDVRRNMQ